MQNITPKLLLKQAAQRLATRGSDSAHLDAEVLLAFVLKKDRTWLLAHNDERIPGRAAARFLRLCTRRMRGEPVAYLTGTQEFYGRPFRVTRSVLVPRQKTELLVEEALARIPANANWHIADIGTGSGNIAVTIALERPHAHIDATDISFRALTVATHNARLHGVENRIRFLQGNLLNPVARRTYQVLLANLPYVPSERPQRTFAERATRHEPAAARYGVTTNRSGRTVLLQFLRNLHARKQKPRCVLLEVGRDQYDGVRFAAQRYNPEYHWILTSPMQTNARILIGKR